MFLRAILIAVLAVSSSVALANERVKREKQWTSAQAVHLISHPSALPPITFSPELSVQQNNARLDERVPESFLLATVDLDRSAALGLKSLVGRRCQVLVDVSKENLGQRFAGEVFAFTISGSSDVKAYVRVKNRRDSAGQWALATKQPAVLRIELP